MSMYSELLAVSMASVDVDGDSMSKDQLLAVLLARRREIYATGAEEPVRAEVADQLVRQIDYDIALIGLCASFGIHTDPAMFGHPRPERMRLEQELVRVGIDLGTFDYDASRR